ncbi:hypothetical protein [Kribbella pratensis]|uniref:Uncharacterized protein n=1 Tax=Kribbella pratensis TaxID=2512112 RepID=A0A4R8CM87_9ACTN|nr:hypothetical protein [Kribbella pratensis]TDW77144.1 hypothetical protein EV653_2308 [Kribbella pratensis]
MQTADIDAVRLHYQVDTPSTARRLDGILRMELTTPQGLLYAEIDQLMRLYGPAEHICLRRLTIRLRYSLTQATAAATIRDACAAAIRAAVRDVPVPEERRGVVVSTDGQLVIYRHHVDAVSDLVRSLSGSGPPNRQHLPGASTAFNPAAPITRTDPAAAALERAWAWEQCGLYSGPLPRSTAARAETITRALTAAPQLIPAVLAQVNELLPLASMQWTAIAHAWAAAIHLPPPASPTESTAASVIEAALASPVGRVLRAQQNVAAGLPVQVRRELASLAIASAAPHHSRGAAVDRVAEAIATVSPISAQAFAQHHASKPPSTLPPRPAPLTPKPEPLSDADRPILPVNGRPTLDADEQPIPAVDDRQLLATDFGALLFLARAVDPVVTEIDLPAVAADLPEVLARLCGRLAGVPPTDPAVIGLTGLDPTADRSPADAVVDELAEARIRGWIRNRLGAQDDDDLGWIWRRRAYVEIAAARVEAVFSLDDVDLTIRRGLLDIDPGWLWWRGAAMRFRYV